MNTTEKIEKPARRETGKLATALTDLFSKGRESALLRILTIVLASGMGEKLAVNFQWNDAKWWMIAAGLGTWWLATELRKIRDDLRAGVRRFASHDGRLDQLEEFKKAHEAAHGKPKRKSRGDLPVLTPEMG